MNVSQNDTFIRGENMIRSFRDRRAEAIFAGRHPGKGFPADLVRPAARKLAMLDAQRCWRICEPRQRTGWKS